MTATALETRLETREDVSDDVWVERIGAGDAEGGLRALQDRYAGKVFHFVQGLLRDPHLAGDVTAEVFAKVFFKHHLYQTGTNFRAWLFEVARNQALSAIRATRRAPRPVSSLQPLRSGDDEADLLASLPEDRPFREPEEREFMAALDRAVEELPARYQEVFELCVRGDLSYEEAAALLGLPTGTVAIRIMRARQRLFRALSRHLDRVRRPPACFQ